MSRFVRQSSYRHTFGTPKKEKYENIKISASAWDTNLVAVSEKYIAVNYQSSGGGAFLVTPLNQTGKHPDQYPLCRAHTAPVLDTAWSNFDDSLIASAGEDGRVAITRIDEQILTDAWTHENNTATQEATQDLEPLYKFNAHARKAGHVAWHPTAENVLASASNDVKIWDVDAQKAVYTSEVHPDMVQSISWDYTGTTYATTCKDKKLRLFDPRTGSTAITIADSHSGIKGSRVEWLGSLDRIVTTGFSKTSERQVYLWDSKDLARGPIKSLMIDQSSGTLMPFWNEGNNVLFLAGKGDGNIRYYEYEADDLFHLAEYSSPSPQRGMAFLPPRALNVAENEIARAFKCVGSTVEPISFVVPRKSESFQADLFPPALSNTAALSSTEWFGGKTCQPKLIDLESRQVSSAVVKPTPTSSTPAPAKEEKKVEKVEKVEERKEEITIFNVPIRKDSPPPESTSPDFDAEEPTLSASSLIAKSNGSNGASTPSPAHISTQSLSTKESYGVVSGGPRSSPAAAVAPAVAVVDENGGKEGEGEGEVVQLRKRNEELKRENERLKGQVAESVTAIRYLELKLEKVKSAMSA